MICFFLIIGIIEICRAIRWDVPSGQAGLHNFNHIPVDHNMMNLAFDCYGRVKQSFQKNKRDLVDPYSWNHIDSPEKKLINGLEAWLAEVIIGKDHHGLVKPIIKEMAYPVYKNTEFKIPYPQVLQETQRYPIFVPMFHPVPYEVIKTIVKTVEKKVPTPVEKIIPVPVEKAIPYEVVKNIPMFVEKKIPIKIPVYKTIHHKLE